MILQTLDYEQRVYINGGARIVCDNGTVLERPVVEWLVDLWAIISTILFFVVLANRIKMVCRSLCYWFNDYRLQIKVFNYIIGLAIREMLCQNTI